MNQRALQKAHESNHPAVTRGSAADRGRGGEQLRACVRPAAAASALPLPLPACGVLARPRSPGRGLARPHRAGAAHGGGRAPAGRSPAGYTAPGRRAPLVHRAASREQGMATASAWGQHCDSAGKSSSPFRSIRRPCVRKIRAEANSYTSYTQQAIKIIFAASSMCKTLNGTSTYTLTHLP